MAKAAGQCHGTPCLGNGVAPASTGGAETSPACSVMVMRVEEATAVGPADGCVTAAAAGIAGLVVPMAQPVLATCCCRWEMHEIRCGTPALLPCLGEVQAEPHCFTAISTRRRQKAPGPCPAPGRNSARAAGRWAACRAGRRQLLRLPQAARSWPGNTRRALRDPALRAPGHGAKKQCWEQPSEGPSFPAAARNQAATTRAKSASGASPFEINFINYGMRKDQLN